MDYQQKLFRHLRDILEDTVLLKENETHQDTLADIEEKTERGMDAYKAVRRVLPKHKHKFESLFEYEADADEDSEGVEDDQQPAKRMRPSSESEEETESEEEDEDAEVSTDDLEDNVAYLEWYNRAKEGT